MPKKKKKDKNEINDDIIIGYNSKKQKDNPPKSKKRKKKKLKKQKNKQEEQNINNNQVNKKPKKKLSKKQQKKKKKRREKIKKILKILLKIIIVFIIIAGIIVFLFVSPVFNIEEITVVGAKEIGESVYIAMSEIEIGENIFSINKENIKNTVKKEPYVESIEINSIYPNRIELKIQERSISYIVEENSKYFYIDKNGYLLETSLSAIDMPIIKNCATKFEKLELGDRILHEELTKFNDLIKIIDAVNNNEMNAKLTSIDIADEDNYILEFKDENKKVMLGESKDLSAKMSWISVFIEKNKNEGGTIYLNGAEVYFSPSN